MPRRRPGMLFDVGLVEPGSVFEDDKGHCLLHFGIGDIGIILATTVS